MTLLSIAACRLTGRRRRGSGQRALSAALALATLIAASPSFAQSDYPSKPIRFLLPFSHGGAGDVLARVTGERLKDAWGAQTVVEPRPGAGGMIATEVAAKSPPDGYTFVIVTVGHAVNPSLYSKIPYDTLTDFIPVWLIAVVQSVLYVHPSVPA